MIIKFITKVQETCNSSKVDAIKIKNSSREICKEKRQDDTFWQLEQRPGIQMNLKKIPTNTNTNVTTLISAVI